MYNNFKFVIFVAKPEQEVFRQLDSETLASESKL